MRRDDLSLEEIAAAYEARVAAVPEAARRFAEENWGKTWAHAEMGSLLDFAAVLIAYTGAQSQPTAWLPMEAAPLGPDPVLLMLEEPISSNDILGWTPSSEARVVTGWRASDWRGEPIWLCCFLAEGEADSHGVGSPSNIMVRPIGWMPMPAPLEVQSR